MIVSWSNIIIGIMIGIAGVVMTFLFYHMLKMNFELMVFNKIRKHEEKYHAKEIKEKNM